MTQNRQLNFIKILNKQKTNEIFGVTQRIDCYIIQNKSIFTKTKIINEKEAFNKNPKIEEINIKNLSFLPNYEYKNIQKILTTKEDGIDIIFDTFYHSSKKMNKTKKEKGGTYIHPVHSINKEGITPLIEADVIKGAFRKKKYY